MKEIILQPVPTCPCGNIARPYSQEDADRWMEYTPYQPVRCKTTGVKKQRSLQQLKLYWVCCGKVAENSSDPEWQTKEDVDFQCRYRLKHFDFKSVNGVPVVTLMRIAIKHLDHLIACRYFDRAFEMMAKHLDITTDSLLENAA